MKKLLKISLIALIICLFETPLIANASSLSLTSGKTTYGTGDIFKVNVNIISEGSALQVVRAKISYPANLLQIQGFTLGSLFPQKSPGESIGNGEIYTGGYRIGEGTSANGLLGTATFKVLKGGTAKISLISGSRMITAEPKDVYSSGNSLTLNLINSGSEKNEVATPEKAAGNEATPNEAATFSAPVINSPTHAADTWSTGILATFDWTKPDGATGYITKLDKEPLDDIGDEINSTKNTETFNNLTDGIWYFHVKAKSNSGFSKTAYYTVKIDNAPPVTPIPSIESFSTQNGQLGYKIFFNTTDDLSGINSYQIKFDEGEYKTASSPYILSDNEKSARFVFVKAIDKAGNFKTGSLAIGEYIAEQEIAFNESKKITLFDIQANAANRSWIEIYAAMAIIGIIFLAAIVWLIIRKKKNK